MIYLELFLSFLEIGAVSFGGGYAMISFIRDTALAHGWLDEAALLDMIAVAESTPGPIAVNMATFVGSSQAGVIGALAATLGVVLPSFTVILVISALIRNLLKYKGVQAFLGGVRPCVVGLILGTAALLFSSTLLGVNKLGDTLSVDIKGLIIFAVLWIAALVYKKFAKKKPSPILMILFSALLGIILYSI